MTKTAQKLAESVSLHALQYLFLSLAACYIVYSLCLAIYHAYFDPLSKFPGPKLAAATQLYEFYYDFFAGGMGGQYTFHIKQMHDKYGPIVRISPYELHIADPDFYDKLYTGSSNPREKAPRSANLFGTPSAFLSTVSHDLHRARRAPLNHFFSTRSVLKLEPMVKDMVEKLCARLDEFRDTGRPVNMRNATAALAMDVVTQYAFAKPYASLDDENFAPHWPVAVDALQESTYLNVYFPKVARIMRSLPVWALKRLHPRTASVVEYIAVSGQLCN
jgi:cytochrome P450